MGDRPTPVIRHSTGSGKGPDVWGLHDPDTGSVQYLCADPATRQAALIDVVWNYDPRRARLSTSPRCSALGHQAPARFSFSFCGRSRARPVASPAVPRQAITARRSRARAPRFHSALGHRALARFCAFLCGRMRAAQADCRLEGSVARGRRRARRTVVIGGQCLFAPIPPAFQEVAHGWEGGFWQWGLRFLSFETEHNHLCLE